MLSLPPQSPARHRPPGSIKMVSFLFRRLGVLPDALNRSDNVRISAAPADIAAHELLHLAVLRSAGFFQQSHCRHDLTRGAIAALVSVTLHKRLLNRMQVFRLTDTLDGRDLLSAVHRSQAKTRIHS